MAKETCIVCNKPGEPCDHCDGRPCFCDSHLAEHNAHVHRARGTASSSRSVDDALAAALAEEGFDHE